MAELFKPEIKDVGGTNVTAYSPPTMDYSGIFNSLARTLDSFEKQKETAPKLSEAEEKNLVLEPYLSKVQKIMSSDEIPEIKKYAMVNGIKLEVSTNYSAYRETFETALGSITKTIDPDGDPIQQYYEDLAKWGETETGAFARVQAISLAVDKDGNFDETVYQTKMKERYHKDIEDKNSFALQKLQNERYKESAPERFRTDFAPKALKGIDESIKLFTSGPGIKAIFDVAKSSGAFEAASPEAAQALALADQVSQLRKWWDVELTKNKIQAGYAPNDPQFSNEPLLLQLKTLEDAFRNAGTSMGTVLKSNDEQFKQVTLAGLDPLARKFITIAGFLPPGASELYTAQALVVPEFRKYITELAKVQTVIGLDPRVSTLGTGTSTTDFIPSGPGVSFDAMVAALPEDNPKMIELVFSAPAHEKTAVLRDTTEFIEVGTLSNETTVEVVNNKLAASYIILKTRLAGAAETGVTPLDQTKIFFGPKAMNLISEIQKKNPVLGEDLYPKVNKAIMTETVRHLAYLQTSLSRNLPNNPILLEVNDKGLVEIKIDPRAKKEDPVLMSLANLGFETDEDLLKNLQTVIAVSPSFYKGLKESVEAINLYLMASNRFPDTLKNSPDFAGVFIREQLASLPRYGGLSVAIEQMGQ